MINLVLDRRPIVCPTELLVGMGKSFNLKIGTYHSFVSAFNEVSYSYDCIFTLLIQNVYDVDIGQILDKF